MKMQRINFYVAFLFFLFLLEKNIMKFNVLNIAIEKIKCYNIYR